jgi:hypothetical protein
VRLPSRGTFTGIVIGALVLGACAAGVAWLFVKRPLPAPPADEAVVAAGATGESPSPVTLHDVTEEWGVTFVHNHGGGGRRYIMETMSAGLALFDYDGDARIDVFFLNGGVLEGTVASVAPSDALYHNLGGGRFREVTSVTGLRDMAHGLGVTVADYDNDGHPDLYVSNYGPKVLYRNNGDGTFSDVTAAAGVADGSRVGAGVCFLDADRDGDLDLYVANYIHFTYDMHILRSVGGQPQYPGPGDFPPEPDTLFRNNGDGTFTDVSDQAGIGQHGGTGMGITCGDYDDDGDTDIFVCNDTTGNFFFENDGTGSFAQVGLEVGTAYNRYGDETASMGVDCADYDNDGRLDFFMTSYQGELPVLYRNLGNRMFEDVTVQTGAGDGLLPHVNWGTAFVDFDRDGYRDLFIANGHTQDLIDLIDPSTAFAAPNSLKLNAGNGQFRDISAISGDGMAARYSSRGAGFDDLDNDGDVDGVVLNLGQKSTVLRNDSPNRHHWLQVQLRGREANRDGVGARVKLTSDDLIQIDEVHSGRGYQGHFGSRLYFGLRDRARVDRLEVRWIGGVVDVIRDLAPDRLVTVVEGTNEAVEMPLGTGTANR